MIQENDKRGSVVLNAIGNKIKCQRIYTNINPNPTEPLGFSLNKKYTLNVVKEIKVTDSFLTLDKETRKCQEERYDDCTTRDYIETLLSQCECLPFAISSNDEVAVI